MLHRIIFGLVLALLLVTPALAKSKDKVYVLKKPKPEEKEVRSLYENKDWAISFDLRQGFEFTEEELEDGTFNLDIKLKNYPISAALVAEPLEDDLTSQGYWRLIRQRDPSIDDTIAYERSVEIDGIPAVQVRLEGANQGGSFLILSLVFASDFKGYMLSCFTESRLLDKVPDFLEELSEGFAFVEDEETETADNPEAVAEEGESAGDESGGDK
jgi:hypothetical protein